ncbi:4-(cytidine 5'-diphospho)-2-C-methyl-D-erythritol kinase [Alkaliphilus oremlandii]|uniref:4-diphosphocytidyl-2-C-methyl-D-erythritol kinase n=1 Tax=Alkaliphilus oremlandii (strain OhILAs) TaxID=350688 RepID=ISPE_ALKOO|nr:4-(cytidine 5'-diphospho)-2-C-methyl-D-erythritol kinase [Alkaliphilus oremlandii]A8ML31.1 RecName: Full=4-diphosphocytidyl-2-C-methyl-D-erythritol kinase; Short=CMK; AltName: Full=4-(cytidine-5'-diphospho)-2-C-methyl-D-erythritol kinase [Alkaliphilus oremlandii OhILAs]ABW17848.1 4-diphosphocytidyl-2C-methyl-D-erythritol kinase [Alkaliphilus oremlandii OhILAs]
MKQIYLKSRAKINLSLDVRRKREDGYHEVEMIMQQIDLYDNILIRERMDSEIVLSTNCIFIPTTSSNIAYKAAHKLKQRLDITRGIDIFIDKQIPVSAGLAGGSSNAAAVLMGLNHLWSLGLSTKELMEIGVTIGADVPFCLLGGTALAEGIGEVLTPINSDIKNTWIVLVKPAISVSTGDVYGSLDLSKIVDRPPTAQLLEAIKEGNIYDVSSKMCNVLETVTVNKYPIITEIKKKMMEYNALGAMMSGSGPTVFGIFKSYERAKSAYEHLSLFYKQSYMVQTYNGGTEIG